MDLNFTYIIIGLAVTFLLAKSDSITEYFQHLKNRL